MPTYSRSEPTRQKGAKQINITNLNIKQGFRFRENSSLISKSFTDFKIRHKESKSWHVSFGYRYSFDWNKKQELRNINRFYTDFTFY